MSVSYQAKRAPHRRLTAEERTEQGREALSRATNGLSCSNYPDIFHGFQALGIALDAIEPRVNIFTYRAWRAKGRQVRKGEHGVQIQTWIPVDSVDKETEEVTHRTMPKRATVFHVSQTDPSEGGVL